METPNQEQKETQGSQFEKLAKGLADAQAEVIQAKKELQWAKEALTEKECALETAKLSFKNFVKDSMPKEPLVLNSGRKTKEPWTSSPNEDEF